MNNDFTMGERINFEGKDYIVIDSYMKFKKTPSPFHVTVIAELPSESAEPGAAGQVLVHSTDFLQKRVTRRSSFGHSTLFKTEHRRLLEYVLRPLQAKLPEMTWDVTERRPPEFVTITLRYGQVGISQTVSAEYLLESRLYESRDVLVVIGQQLGAALEAQIMELGKKAALK